MKKDFRKPILVFGLSMAVVVLNLGCPTKDGSGTGGKTPSKTLPDTIIHKKTLHIISDDTSGTGGSAPKKELQGK